jgi:pyrroline-5-carboxylate reductase
MLRQNVTSPGGTTAAALQVLMEPDGMQSLLIRAVARGDEAFEGAGEVKRWSSS